METIILITIFIIFVSIAVTAIRDDKEQKRLARENRAIIERYRKLDEHQ